MALSSKEVEKKIAELLTQIQALKEVVYPTDLRPIVKRKRDEFLTLCKKNGVPVRVTSQVRSWAEQDKLYAQGRTTSGKIVTNAKGGESMHNHGLAFDVCFDSITPWIGDWDKVGKLGESIGLEWGGRWASFVDRPHFQYLAGYTEKDIRTGKHDFDKFT